MNQPVLEAVAVEALSKGAAPRIRELEASGAERWDAFVSGCSEATFFHRAGWKTVIERAFGHRTYFLYAEAGGRIEGVLPLAEVKSLLFGHTLASLPFCVYGGVAATSERARRRARRGRERAGAEAGCRSPGIPLAVAAPSRLGAQRSLRHVSQGARSRGREEPARDPAQAARHGAQGHQERAEKRVRCRRRAVLRALCRQRASPGHPGAAPALLRAPARNLRRRLQRAHRARRGRGAGFQRPRLLLAGRSAALLRRRRGCRARARGKRLQVPGS